MRGLLRLAVLSVAGELVSGHGMITYPPSRVGGNLRDAAKYGDMDDQTFANASWYTSFT